MRKIYRHILLIAISIAALIALLSAADYKTTQEAYIAKYSAIAVSEMYRSGVPASITLAQGLLESNAGLSVLSTQGNNHFGIKCHNWTGKKMYHDDDEKGECFRVYDSALESFSDHSDFLRYRDRYKFLFENETTDYKSWAQGLKRAGYATDPAYPSKLIKLIEDFKLYRFDTMTVDDVLALNPESEAVSAAPTTTVGKAVKATKSKKRRKTPANTSYKDNSVPEIPASPLSIEEAKPYENKAQESFSFSLSRQMLSKNGIPFVNAVEGETYATIASSYKLFIKEILAFNDLDKEEVLEPGTIVYLQAKKNQAPAGLDKYIVGEEPETLRDICQRFGVKKSSIEKINGFAADYQPREGDTILLREPSNGILSSLKNKKK